MEPLLEHPAFSAPCRCRACVGRRKAPLSSVINSFLQGKGIMCLDPSPFFSDAPPFPDFGQGGCSSYSDASSD